MAKFLLAYDLRAPGRDYQALYDELARFQACHDQESLWFLVANNTAAEIRDHFSQFIDGNDRLFVTEIDNRWAGRNMRCGDWLNEN